MKATLPYGRGIGPHPIDIRVGTRLRQRRVLLGMNQESLGALLGVTFQQIQKYEGGTNRISAGRLHHIAGLLEVPVEWFYEAGPALGREELELLALFCSVPPPVAAGFLDLMRTAGEAA